MRPGRATAVTVTVFRVKFTHADPYGTAVTGTLSSEFTTGGRASDSEP